MGKQPLDHVIRAVLPWRTGELTECGRELADVAAAITIEQLIARIKEHGKQRTAFTVCITCWTTAHSHRHDTWELDPIGVMGREAERCGMYRVHVSQTPERDQLTAELRAIEALIAAHRDEFDQYIAGLGESIDLDAARRARKSTQQKKAAGNRPQ
ncbi:Uncharacterised protein [Mycobacteroides abscessus subsp. abscessus]|jgi:hypothetical protein|uniref:hypothetical protein n=1 Tax=Mycobacteroides abscessus TaxID=36809 RepID=UPI000928B54A|nr:hypothetical protein [Mycobacteroides abscessus]SIH23813.1 Uncharacterised protein [Mycobacteroides abscessus subsp. abscessus]